MAPSADANATLNSGGGRQPLMLIASVILSLVLCGGLLVYGSGRGLDLTDEIFYLIWTRDPNAYALTYQPFGFLLHPLYVLVGGDLQSYRLEGFAIAAGAGGFVGASLPLATRTRLIFALYGAASALTIFFPWIITPSYNSAANVGALLIIGGVLHALRGSVRGGVAGATATGAGLCIAAFSKPPLFAIAFAAIAVAALFARRPRPALIASLLIGIAALSLFIAPAHIPLLVRRIIWTQRVLSLPNTPLGLPGKVLRDWLAVPLPLSGAALAAGLAFALRRFWWGRSFGYVAILLSLYYAASIVPDAIDGSIPDFLGLAVLLSAAGYACFVDYRERASRIAIPLLLVAPVIVALGTFNNQWFQLNFSMAFPFLALFALSFLDHCRWRRIAAQGLAIMGPVAVLLLASWAPYSLPGPIFDQQTPIDPPLARGPVLVDDETATFAGAARGRARGILLVDLSGTGPGVGALLGADLPVLPWLNPATPTWPDVVWSQLSRQQRQGAWFVAPVWPQFARTAPARWLMSHRPIYCRTSLPPMTFWGEERSLEIWRPCADAPSAPKRRAAPPISSAEG